MDPLISNNRKFIYRWKLHQSSVIDIFFALTTENTPIE